MGDPPYPDNRELEKHKSVNESDPKSSTAQIPIINSPITPVDGRRRSPAVNRDKNQRINKENRKATSRTPGRNNFTKGESEKSVGPTTIREETRR